MKTPIFSLTLALSLAACGPKANDSSICSTYSQPDPAIFASYGWPEKLNLCVHKWSYRLAKSKETAEVVATSAVAACEDALSNAIGDKVGSNRAESVGEFNAAMKAAREDNSARPRYEDFEPPSLEVVTRELRGLAQRDALFRVTQARAGNCDAP